MAEELQVEGSITKEGVILLVVKYGQELLLKEGAPERLSKALTGRYREMLGKDGGKVRTMSCVVEIQSEIAGSPLVRALFELWKEVVGKESGQVICVNYPPDYIDSLTSLGLPSLAGFSLAVTREEAIQSLMK